jgi:hypothetical protein
MKIRRTPAAKAEYDLASLTARLEAAPFQKVPSGEFFRNDRKLCPSQTSFEIRVTQKRLG